MANDNKYVLSNEKKRRVLKTSLRMLKGLNVFRVNHRTKLVKIKFNFEGV